MLVLTPTQEPKMPTMAARRLPYSHDKYDRAMQIIDISQMLFKSGDTERAIILAEAAIKDAIMMYDYSDKSRALNNMSKILLKNKCTERAYWGCWESNWSCWNDF